MFRLLQAFTNWFFRVILRLRYRIKIDGLDQVTCTRGVLILPNHPGEMDPVILVAHLWPKLRPHPMAVEDFYWMPGVHYLLKLIGTIPVPNTDGRMGAYKKLRVENSLDKVIELLDAGENVLIYPSGRLMRDTIEHVGAASAVSDILSRRPETPVVVIRSTGLLGSMFAWLSHRVRPNLGKCLKQSFIYSFMNGILFMPRRDVSIEVIQPGDEFPRHDGKMAINGWLEEFYNKYGPEQPKPVSYLFWKKEYFQTVAKEDDEEAVARIKSIKIADDIHDQVISYLAEISGQDTDSIEPQHRLAKDLGMDSLTTGEVVVWLESTFRLVDIEVQEIPTVHDVMVAASGKLPTDHRESGPAKTPDGWPGPDSAELYDFDQNTTIQENFLAISGQQPSLVAMADDTSGILTRKKLRTGVILLAEIIRQRPEQNVGVMLPASAGASMVTLAVLLAGKTPVMLNWTLGDANLKHVIQVSDLKAILTSGRFLDRLTQLNVKMLEDYLVTLEDLKRKQISLSLKLRALWLAGKSAPALVNRFKTDTWDADKNAVILFTSGSEAAPKGVPLTHRNVLANLNGALTAVHLKGSDTLYGFLPPFHSFGFTVTTIMPSITGLRTAYYPNPTESGKLARGIAIWKPTIICGTPTFVAGIFRACGEHDAKSLRVILTGAEKASEDLFTKLAEMSPDASLLEGYGITETSPVLTFTRPGEARIGVGKPMHNIELLIVDLENEKPLPTGERGLILAHGPNVFNGYIGRDSDDVFRDIDGKRYYVTGDLGFLDDAGNLTLAGRLKRFVKIGGEMISIPAMEEILKQTHPDEDGVSTIALSYLERDGDRPILGAFTTFDTTLDALNHLLTEGGFSNLGKLSIHQKLAELPQLGTGKTDYRSLTALLKEAAE